MKVKCCRGVCVGVDQHLKPGEIAEVDAAHIPFLVSIGAVEVVREEPVVETVVEPIAEPKTKSRNKEQST